MRLLWSCALIVAGTLYLGLVLFGGVESPLFALAFVALAGREVIHTHGWGRSFSKTKNASESRRLSG